MTNDENAVVEDEFDEVDESANVDETTESDEDATDWKAKFEESEGRRRRLETKLNKSAEKPEPQSKKSNDLDYGELAFLTAKGVENDDEVDFVKTIINNTGRSLKDVVGDDYVQAKLSAMRDARAVKDATPSGTKRSAQSASDSVEYWLSKGELPDDTDLRRKVVNARIEKETKKDVFTP